LNGTENWTCVVCLAGLCEIKKVVLLEKQWMKLRKNDHLSLGDKECLECNIIH
jgi:hypothetical protein